MFDFIKSILFPKVKSEKEKTDGYGLTSDEWTILLPAIMAAKDAHMNQYRRALKIMDTEALDRLHKVDYVKEVADRFLATKNKHA